MGKNIKSKSKKSKRKSSKHDANLFKSKITKSEIIETGSNVLVSLESENKKEVIMIGKIKEFSKEKEFIFLKYEGYDKTFPDQYENPCKFSDELFTTIDEIGHPFQENLNDLKVGYEFEATFYNKLKKCIILDIKRYKSSAIYFESESNNGWIFDPISNTSRNIQNAIESYTLSNGWIPLKQFYELPQIKIFKGIYPQDNNISDNAEFTAVKPKTFILSSDGPILKS